MNAPLPVHFLFLSAETFCCYQMLPYICTPKQKNGEGKSSLKAIAARF